MASNSEMNDNKNSLQEENDIVEVDKVTRYQTFYEPDVGVTSYGKSVEPLMGVEPDMSMSKVLDRMVVVGQKQWLSSLLPPEFSPTAGSMAAYTPLAKYDFPDALLADSFIRDKSNNWSYLHSDVYITVKVNATNFQCGALFISFDPRSELLDPNYDILYNHMRSITSFPGTYLNLSNSDSVTLRMPYCSEFESFSLYDAVDRGSFGSLLIDVVSPLRLDGSPTEVTVTIYASFVEPKNYVPCVNSVDSLTSREAVAIERAQKKSIKLDIVEQAGNPNARGKKGAPTQEREQEMKSGGLLSTVSGIVSDIGFVASRIPIPFVSQLANNIGWFGRKAKGVLESYGFSKPDSVCTTRPTVIQSGRGLNHVEGVDLGNNLGTIQDNFTDTVSAVVSEADETSLGYIFNRDWVQLSLDWSKVVPVDTPLFDDEVSALHQSPTPGTVAYWSSAQLAISQFRYFRGGLDVTLMAVKTFAHSGRLQIAITPPSSTGALTGDFPRATAMIWDIAESDTFCFHVPYLSNIPWTNSPDSFAHLSIRVLNPLQAPDSVSDNINILFRMNPSKESRVAVPITPRVALGFIPPALDIVEMSGDMNTNLATMSPGEGDRVDDTSLSEVQCIGESFVSLRALSRRAITYQPLGTTLTNSAYIVPTQDYYPGVSGTQTSVEALPQATLINTMYRFCAGSSRYKFVFMPGYTVIITLKLFDNTFTDYLPHTVYNTTVNNVAEVTVPYYNKFRKTVKTDFWGNLQASYQICIRAWDAQSVVLDPSSIIVEQFYATGDDYNYHYMIGPPVVHYP